MYEAGELIINLTGEAKTSQVIVMYEIRSQRQEVCPKTQSVVL